ncbi:MAG: ATP-grasp domain-containing protein [Patescibacteria group bacterium]|nr:ATP-grasp domain-containing protein [Patescibacteria group bacterium]
MKPSSGTIVYVSREIERALGMEPCEGYRIVSNRSPYGETVKERFPGFVALVDAPDGAALGTAELIRHPETEKLVGELERSGTQPSILVFKNTARIEPLIREKGWRLLNPPAAASERIENKVSQVQWLGELERRLPPHRLQFMKSVEWRGEPFIVQWAHGHTGAGTILVDSEEALRPLKERFPERRARIARYIDGPSFTVNVVVSPESIEAAGISYQITGLAPFTDSPFTTVGNDWGVVGSLLTGADVDAVRTLVGDLGAKMRAESWRGLFGIDLIKDRSSGELRLIEVNARQPASATFESSLQEAERAKGADGLTTFEAHIAALSGQPLEKPVIEIAAGAQIVQRVTATVSSVPAGAAAALEKEGFTVVSYGNSKEHEDLLRVQSAGSLMAGHGALNDAGRMIAGIVSPGPRA